VPGRVVVVGGGVTGMAAAIRLAERGRPVAVFDPAPHAGGLADGFEVRGTSVERFYHHLFRTDLTAARWIDDLGLAGRFEFRPASMGFFISGRLHRFGTPISVLRFAPLPFADRVKLGLRVRGLSQTPSAAAFENVTALSWLGARASSAELRGFWIPLLEAKFGADRDLVSMAWLWARFRARLGSSLLTGERLGYLRGGFQQLGDQLAARAARLGVEMHLGARVEKVSISEDRVRGVDVAGVGRIDADAVIWTPSLNVLARAVPELPEAYRARCTGVSYHTAIVMVLELQASALPYYWVTIGDPELPFTVAVEHTRFVPASDYGGRTVIYLGRYAPPDHPIVKSSDEEITGVFLAAATKAFGPGFREPLAAHVFRAPAAQPIVPPGWGETRPGLRTGLAGLVAANMAQIYPWDRGINYSLQLGEDAAAAVDEELEALPRAAG
jgi:protoporphyrinogen oxidase